MAFACTAVVVGIISGHGLSTLFAGFSKFEIMLVEMLLKIFFRNHIYWDVFENLTFRNLPAIRYLWSDLWKLGIMAHTKICSIMHYKNLVQIKHFIKNLVINKGCNLAILTPICKNWPSPCSLSREEYKIFELILYYNVFVRHERLWVCKNGIYLSVFSHFPAVILSILTKLIYIWNRRFTLGRMVFVSSPYIKVPVSYDHIIKYM